MLEASLGQIAETLGGVLPNDEEGAAGAVSHRERFSRRVRGVTIDSRGDVAGRLFVGLPGQQVDGAAFAEAALARGAAAALVGPGGLVHPAVLRVPDPLAALARLAGWWRSQLAARVIAVTGSVGKTTTRQMLACMLAEAGATQQSPGNFNNALGVPLTLLATDRKTRWLVVEIGTSGPGEIAPLARLAAPDLALLTAAGPSHLEGLGTLAAVAQEKLSLAEVAPRSLLARDNWRQPLVARGAIETVGREGCDHRVQPAGVWAKPSSAKKEPLPRRAVRVGSLRVPGGYGEHHDSLVALAVVAACDEGVAAADVIAGLTTWQPDAGRGRVHRRGAGLLIDESYNANPQSMLAAAELLATAPRPRTLIAGDMVGLGDRPDDEAATRDAGDDWATRTGRALAALPLDRVIAVGPLARRMAAASGHPFAIAPDAEAAGALAANLPGTVLVKGSRAIGLDRTVHQLLAAGGGESASASSTH